MGSVFKSWPLATKFEDEGAQQDLNLVHNQVGYVKPTTFLEKNVTLDLCPTSVKEEEIKEVVVPREVHPVHN